MQGKVGHMPDSLTAPYRHAARDVAAFLDRIHLTTLELLILAALCLVVCVLLQRRRRSRRALRNYPSSMPPTWGAMYRDVLAQAHERPARLGRGSHGVDTFGAVQERFMRVQSHVHEAVQQELARQEEAVHAK